MPRMVGALFLILVGSGVLAVAYRGHREGVLPAGSSFHRSYRPSRDDNPIAYHLFLALYFAGGLTLVVWGLLSLIGLAPALELR